MPHTLCGLNILTGQKERGYDKFVDIAVNTQKVIKACQDARADMNVFLLYHAEAVSDMTSIIGYKVATIGKLLDQSYNPIEVVPVVLFSTSFFDDNGNPTYGFYTKKISRWKYSYSCKIT